MNRNNLLLCGHGGLGDHIICNAIVRDLAPNYELICLPVKYHNVASVSWMFSDLPNVTIRPVEHDQDMIFFREEVWKYNVLNIGGFGHGYNGQEWDKSMFAQAGVPFEKRWTGWHCPRDLKEEERVLKEAMRVNCLHDEMDWNVFVHQDPARGMKIDVERCHVVSDTDFDVENVIQPVKNITPIQSHWRTAIEACDEIHCISSSFSAFIDSIELPKNPKLFLHGYCRPNEPLCSYRKNWEVLK